MRTDVVDVRTCMDQTVGGCEDGCGRCEDMHGCEWWWM